MPTTAACPGFAYEAKESAEVVRRLTDAGAIVFVIGAAVAGGLLWHYSKDLPDSAQLRNYEPPVMTRIHAGDGSLLAEFAKERRLFVIPPDWAINRHL